MASKRDEMRTRTFKRLGVGIQMHNKSKFRSVYNLSKNIARLAGYESNPAVIIRCSSVVVHNLVDMKLDHLIDLAGKEL